MIKRRDVGLLMAAAAGLAILSGGPAAAADPPALNLSFVKFNVANQPAMAAFYEKAFGMTLQKTVDNPGITEIILTDPKGLDLALVHYKDGRKIALGNANGPIGFYLQDVDSVYKSAMAAGATSVSAPGGGGGLRVAIVADPEGHEIELLHLP